MARAPAPTDKPDRRWPADKIELRAIGTLLPYARNARLHSDAQVDQIAASIKEWGWTNPVLVDEASTIIAGHGRVLAAHKLGIAMVPVMIARGWTDEQVKAYRIADNKLSLLSSWDEELLAADISELQAGELLQLTGFTLPELATLGLEANDPLAEWAGMPEFQQNSAAAFKTIAVHFKDAEAVALFATLVGQTIGPKTRYVWYPQAEIERCMDKQYTTSATAA